MLRARSALLSLHPRPPFLMLQAELSTATLQLFERMHNVWAAHPGPTITCWWSWMLLLRDDRKCFQQV